MAAVMLLWASGRFSVISVTGPRLSTSSSSIGILLGSGRRRLRREEARLGNGLRPGRCPWLRSAGADFLRRPVGTATLLGPDRRRLVTPGPVGLRPSGPSWARRSVGLARPWACRPWCMPSRGWPIDCGAIGVARLGAPGGVTAVGISVTGERAAALAATVTAMGGPGWTPPGIGAGGRPPRGRRPPEPVRAGRAGGDQSDGGLVAEGGGSTRPKPGGIVGRPGPRTVPHPIRGRSRRPEARPGRPDRPLRRSRARRPAPPAGRDRPVPALSPAPSGGAEPSSPAPRTPPAPGRGGPPGRLAAPGLRTRIGCAPARGVAGRPAGRDRPVRREWGSGRRRTEPGEPVQPEVPSHRPAGPGRVVRSIESAWNASCRRRPGPPGAGRRGGRGPG